MELALQRYGSYEKFEQITGGNLLTKGRIWHNVKKYMEKEGCIGEVRGQETLAWLFYSHSHVHLFTASVKHSPL